MLHDAAFDQVLHHLPMSHEKMDARTRWNYLTSEITKTAQIHFRILGECLLISSLPGKASRMLVE